MEAAMSTAFVVFLICCFSISQAQNATNPQTGHWSSWEAMSPCSVTCGTGVQSQLRRWVPGANNPPGSQDFTSTRTYRCTAGKCPDQPTLDSAEANVTAEVGSAVSLPCAVSNLGTDKVSWSNEKSKVLFVGEIQYYANPRMSLRRPTENDWNIYIEDVTTQDAGIYTCKVLTKPPVFKVVRLTVKEPELLDTEVNITAVVGSEAVLPCAVSSLGDYQVYWANQYSEVLYRGERPMVNNPKMVLKRPLEKDWNLHLLEVSPRDAGTYTCRINTKPPLVKRVRLAVMSERARFLPGPREVIAQLGQTAVLPCSVTTPANSTLTLLWKKYSSPVPLTLGTVMYTSDANFALGYRRFQEGSVTVYNLTISATREEDEGVYECLITTGQMDAKRVRLIVQKKQEKPELLDTAVNISAVVGSEAVLPCAVSNLGDYQVYWANQFSKVLYRGERPMVNNPKMVLKRPLEKDWNLHLLEVSPRDAGTYTCRINTKPQLVKTVRLAVSNKQDGRNERNEQEERARFFPGPREVIAQLGQTAVLPCSVTIPANSTSKLVWKKYPSTNYLTVGTFVFTSDSNFALGYRRLQESSVTEYNLTIRAAREEDEGVYDCLIPSGQTDGRRVRLVVQTKTGFGSTPETVTAVVGTTAVLQCSINNLGDHKAIWVDFRNTVLTYQDRIVTDDARISLEQPTSRDWNLRIGSVTKNDEGRFSCKINTSPHMTRFVDLQVQEPSVNRKVTSVTFKEGQRAILPCSVTQRGNLQIVWRDPDSKPLMLRNRRITTDPRISIIRPFRKDWNLLIRAVTLVDQGIYTCAIGTQPPTVQEIELLVEPGETTTDVTTEIPTTTAQKTPIITRMKQTEPTEVTTRMVTMTTSEVTPGPTECDPVKVFGCMAALASNQDICVAVQETRTCLGNSLFGCPDAMLIQLIPYFERADKICAPEVEEECRPDIALKCMTHLTGIEDIYLKCHTLPETKECLTKATVSCKDEMKEDILSRLEPVNIECEDVCTNRTIDHCLSKIVPNDAAEASPEYCSVLQEAEECIINATSECRTKVKETLRFPLKNLRQAQRDCDYGANYTSMFDLKCDADKIAVCLENLGALSTLNTAFEICQILNETKECLQGALEGCGDDAIMQMEPIFNQSEAVCNDVPFSLLNMSIPCNQTKAVHCLKPLAQMMTGPQICSTVDSVQQCMGDALGDCSDDEMDEALMPLSQLQGVCDSQSSCSLLKLQECVKDLPQTPEDVNNFATKKLCWRAYSQARTCARKAVNGCSRDVQDEMLKGFDGNPDLCETVGQKPPSNESVFCDRFQAIQCIMNLTLAAAQGAQICSQVDSVYVCLETALAGCSDSEVDEAMMPLAHLQDMCYSGNSSQAGDTGNSSLTTDNGNSSLTDNVVATPVNVQLQNFQQGSVTVTWDKVPNSKIYVVWVQELGKTWVDRLFSASETSIEVDIQPSTDYAVRVSAVSDQEVSSAWSNSLYFDSSDREMNRGEVFDQSSLPGYITVKEGDRVAMKCPESVAPQGEVTVWTDDEPTQYGHASMQERVSSDSRYNINFGILVISSVKWSDTGRYQCFANSNPSVNATFFVVVEGADSSTAPYPPESIDTDDIYIRAVPLTANSILVSVDGPDDMKRIRFKYSENAGSLQRIGAPALRRYVVVDNLKANTRYFFSVKARAGKRHRVASGTARTLPGLRAPSNVTVDSSQSADRALIQWQYTQDEQNMVLGFVVQVKPVQGNSSAVETTVYDTTRAVVGGLQPEVYYSAKVTAFDYNGLGTESKLSFFTLDANNVHSLPKNMRR